MDASTSFVHLLSCSPLCCKSRFISSICSCMDPPSPWHGASSTAKKFATLLSKRPNQSPIPTIRLFTFIPDDCAHFLGLPNVSSAFAPKSGHDILDAAPHETNGIFSASGALLSTCVMAFRISWNGPLGFCGGLFNDSRQWNVGSLPSANSSLVTSNWFASQRSSNSRSLALTSPNRCVKRLLIFRAGCEAHTSHDGLILDLLVGFVSECIMD